VTTTDNSASSNAESTERLRSLVARLSPSNLAHDLGGDWTVAFALAHLAFWDARQIAALRRFSSGEDFPSEDYATNDTLELISSALNPATIGEAAVNAARQLDATVEALTNEQREALRADGKSYAIDRAPHRDEHLQQIEQGLD
jgi:hypothetical protein